ncbi:hypothetical protein PHYPSEUDO_012631 [Phytophthora pseudosyringae]|uniref:Uncharacterized protein n=1 Tax=Phytophthora pseudosyringae TaxID=221518 RepID=A0A8T1V777_9STRA|nr:hypothetical protein PHYPSEUDO_012631 [Phytophthora pseudosyringae]
METTDKTRRRRTLPRLSQHSARLRQLRRCGSIVDRAAGHLRSGAITAAAIGSRAYVDSSSVTRGCTTFHRGGASNNDSREHQGDAPRLGTAYVPATPDDVRKPVVLSGGIDGLALAATIPSFPTEELHKLSLIAGGDVAFDLRRMSPTHSCVSGWGVKL